MHPSSVSLALRCAFLAVLALTALAAPASAQQWTPVPPFNAGDWTKCVAGPDGEVFVIHQSGTLYRSTDNGAHWSNTTPANVRTVTAILAQPGGVVFAGVTIIGADGDPPAVFVSADGGASWQSSAVLSNVGDPVAGLAMTGGGTLFAVTQFGSVWSSTDLGSSWGQLSNLPSGANPLPVVHDFLMDANSILFAANDNAVYTSSDGSSWSSLSVGAPVLHLATNPNGLANYFATSNATYQYPPPDGLPIFGAPGGSLGWLSDGSLLIDGRFRYDGGSVAATTAQVPGTVNDVALISGTTLMEATSQGIFVSSDDLSSFGGAAPPGGVPLTLLGALGSSGVLVSDGDEAFASRFAGDPMQRTLLTGSMLPFAVVPTASGGFAASRNGGVYGSADGGLTWGLLSDFGGMHVQALARGSSGLVLVGTDGSSGDPLFASGDEGVSWAQMDPTTFVGDQVTALTSSGTTYFAGVLDALLVPRLLVSTDGDANTWSLAGATPPARVDRLAAVSSTELYALCAGTLLQTLDAGASWNPVRGGVTSVVADAAGHLWATMDSAPYAMLSIDHGASWMPVDAGTSGVIGSLVVSPSQELYAAGSAGGYRSAPPACPTPGLVASWPAEGNPNDVSGSYHNGVLQNGATFDTGKVGSAFSLDGVNDNVSVPNSSAFSFSSAMSVAGWIKTTAGNDRYIATKHDDSFYFAVGGGSVAPHKLSFWLNGPSTSWFAGVTSVDDGQWHHVAATYDGTTMRVYVDGHLDGSAPRTGAIQSGGSSILIGARYDGTNAGNFPGLIDELAVYNRALGSAEVQALAALSEPCAAAGVGDAPGVVRAFELAPPWPNPATRLMNFEFRTPDAAMARAEILDVAGRRVSQPLEDQLLPGGIHRFQWDGLNASGARVAAGVYLIRVTSGKAAAIQRIVLVR